MSRKQKLSPRDTGAELGSRLRKKVGPAVTLPSADVQVGLSALARIARRDDPAITIYGAMLETLDGCAEMLGCGMLAGAYVQGRSVLEHGLQLLYGISHRGMVFAALQEIVDEVIADHESSAKHSEFLSGMLVRMFSDEGWRAWRQDYQAQADQLGYPPHWYSVMGGPRSLRELAERIQAGAFYDVYSALSAVVHGAQSATKHSGNLLEFDGDPIDDLIVPLHGMFCLASATLMARHGKPALTAFRRDLANVTGPVLRRAELVDALDESMELVDGCLSRHASAESPFPVASLRKLMPYNPSKARSRMTALMGMSLQRRLNLFALSGTMLLDFARRAAYDTHVARALLGLYRQLMESFNAFVNLICAGCIMPAAVQARSVADIATQVQYLARLNDERLAAACLVAGRVGVAWTGCNDFQAAVPPPDGLTVQERSAWTDLDELRRRERKHIPWYRLLNGPGGLNGLLRFLGEAEWIEHLHMLNRHVHRASFVDVFSTNVLRVPRSAHHEHWNSLVVPCFEKCSIATLAFAEYFRLRDIDSVRAIIASAVDALDHRQAGASTV